MLPAFLIFLLFLSPIMIGIWTAGDIGIFYALIFYALVFGATYLYTKTPAYKKKKAQKEAEIQEVNSLASFDEETGVLTLHKRSPLIVRLISLQESKDVYIDYKPKTLHVGAVSVGGVTSGGAYTTGGYNYISAEKKNGLCTMVYKKAKIIRKIKLSQADYTDAEQSIVSSFLNAETQQINVIDDVEVDAFERRMAFEQYKRTGYVGNEAAHRGYPTLEKGLKILDWLTAES